MVATITGGSGKYDAKVVNGNIIADDVNNPDGQTTYTYSYEPADGTGTFVMTITDRDDPTKTATAQFAVTSAPIVITHDIAIYPIAADVSKTSAITHDGDTQTITLKVGETYTGDTQRVATDGSAIGGTGIGCTFTPTSSDTVASYTYDGNNRFVATAKAVGIVEYALKSGDTTAHKKIKIVVIDTPITSLAWDGNAPNADILTGYKLPLKVKVTPADATNQKVDWVSAAPPVLKVENDSADTNGSDGIATALTAGTGTTVTGTSQSGNKSVTATIDVIDAADPDLYLYVQNNIGTQTGWQPAQDATDKNKWTISTTLSTTGRYMGAFVRKSGSTTNITGAADGLTAVSSDPSVVLVDNVGGHGFQMHPKKVGTADITITTPAGAGHPTTPIVAILTITLT